MEEKKAICQQDLFPLWSKYKRSFWKGLTYAYTVEMKNGEVIYSFPKNSLNTPCTMSASYFEKYFSKVS